MNDIYAFGSGLIDLEFEVPEGTPERLGLAKGQMTLAEPDRQRQLLEQLRVEFGQPQQHPGGSAVNSLVTAALMGARCALSVRLADDQHGEIFMQSIRDAGIDCDAALLSEGSTGICLVLITPDAERTMSTSLGVSSDFSREDLHSGHLANSTYVYSESYLMSQSASSQALLLAHQQTSAWGRFCLSASDPWVVEVFAGTFAQLQRGGALYLLFCNEQELYSLAKDQHLASAQAAVGANAEHLVVTLGARGVSLSGSGGVHRIDGEAVHAVSTLGAGDTFAGALLYALTQKLDMVASGRFANRAAALVVQHAGPRLSTDTCRALAAGLQTG